MIRESVTSGPLETTGLTAHSLDISTRQVVLSHDQLLQIHVFGQGHPRGMQLEDMTLGLGIRHREF